MAKEICCNKVFSVFLRNAEHGAKAGGLLHQGKIFGGQGLQRESTFAAFEQQFVLIRFQSHRLIGGHGAQDVHEFASTDGGAETPTVATQRSFGSNLNFQIAGGQLQVTAGFANHHIGQDRQGVATLNDACNGLQRGQNVFLGGFQDNHVILFLISLYFNSGSR